jgi:hypothetical protein
MLNRTDLNEALRPQSGCLTPEELEKYAENPAAGHSHIAECPRCQAELALLKSFDANEALPDEGAAVAWISARLDRQLDQIKHPGHASAANASERRTSWFSRTFGIGAAGWMLPIAAAVVVAVATVALLHQSKEPQLRADAGNGPAVYRSQEVEVKGPVGEVVEAPKALEWKVFPGVVEYKVSIMEVDEVPLWTGQTRDQILTIPDAVRGKMLPGKPLLWRVTAVDSQGRTLAVSQVQHFSVQRKSPGPSSGILPR